MLKRWDVLLRTQATLYMFVTDFTFQFVQMNNTNADLLTMLSLYNDFITNKYANRPTL